MKSYTSVDNYRIDTIIRILNSTYEYFVVYSSSSVFAALFIVIPVLVYFLRQQTVRRQSTKGKVE